MRFKNPPYAACIDRMWAGLRFALGLSLGLGLGLALGACSPDLNWREARLKPAGAPGVSAAPELTALLPCKPDQASRQVPLTGAIGGANVQHLAELRMMGCDALGATFAVSALTPSGIPASDALALWRKATLNNLAAHDIQETPLPTVGMSGMSGMSSAGGQTTKPSLVTAQGKRPDGGAVTMQAVWWVQGAEVYHAVIYADRISTDMTDSFFTGLKVKTP